MIKTKAIINDITDIPTGWIFKHYLKIPEDLTGQDIMIKSIFNPNDKKPSMSIFVWQGKNYRFNDHSTGKRGSAIDLVMTLENLDYVAAVAKITSDYNDFITSGNQITDFKAKAKFSISDHVKRPWSAIDKKYWTQYEIGSKELEYFNVFPLERYTLNNGEKDLIIQGSMIYGYFTSWGEIYKTYQPFSTNRRFMKFKNYIQGHDQLKGKSKTLVITKSLKDVIAFYNTFGYEAISCDSENVILKEDYLKDVMKPYEKTIVVLDSDEAGIRNMKIYEEQFNLPTIILPWKKDLSDGIKQYGSEKVKEIFNKLL